MTSFFRTFLLALAGVLVAAGPNRGMCLTDDDGFLYCSRQRLFVLSVGVNDYGPQALQFAESDARRLAARFVADYGPPPSAPPSDSAVTQVVLTGSAATKTAVARAFETAVRRLRSGDVFIFYFAGLSTNVSDSGAGGGTQIALSGSQVGNTLSNALHTRQPDSVAVDTRQLKLWLDNIAASRQLVIMDAGQTGSFFEEFVATVSVGNPLEADLTQRNRIIVAPQTIGFENSELQGGLLTHMLITAPAHLLQRTFGKRRRSLELELDAQQDTSGLVRQYVAPNEYYAGVFYEADVLPLLRRMARAMGLGQSSGAVRGFGANSAPQARRRAGIGRSVALVIGTSEYGSGSGWPHLVNPTEDARAVAGELEQSYGFETRLLIDPSRNEIQAALRDLQHAPFDTSDKSTDEVLIFFAGHGYYDEGMSMGFLVAKDSRAVAQDPYLESYLSYGNLAPWIDNIPSRHVLVVIDACFGGTFDQSIRAAGARGSADTPYPDASSDELIARKLRLRSRQYLTSGGKEYVPDGRPGMHSPFTRRFLEALRDPGPDGILTISKLRAALERVTPEPRAGGFGKDDPGSDFLFVRRR
jgi:uncharacterized caspase-like protein